MSTLWSLTYVKTKVSISEVFDAVVSVFRQEIDGKLYDIEPGGESYLGRSIISLWRGILSGARVDNLNIYDE
jgi:hypothetical protein